MRHLGTVIITLLAVFCIWSSSLAALIDLSTFTADSGVTESGGVITFTEDINQSAMYFFNASFYVDPLATYLTFNYEMTLGEFDDDYLVACRDANNDGQIDYFDDEYFMEIGSSDSLSGTFSIDLSGFRSQTLWLGFGLESNDWEANTIATISNIDLATEKEQPAPVPEPGTMLLLGSGLVGLVSFRKRILK